MAEIKFSKKNLSHPIWRFSVAKFLVSVIAADNGPINFGFVISHLWQQYKGI